jgi:ATP-dependent DNA helicase RecG
MTIKSFNPGKRASELAEALDTPLRTLERWLKQLKAKGLIEFKGVPKTGGYYILSTHSLPC